MIYTSNLYISVTLPVFYISGITYCFRFKGTRQLDEDKRIDISSEGNKYYLTIHDCYGEDADDYSVRASTAAGTRQSRAKATIRCKIIRLNC